MAKEEGSDDQMSNAGQTQASDFSVVKFYLATISICIYRVNHTRNPFHDLGLHPVIHLRKELSSPPVSASSKA